MKRRTPNALLVAATNIIERGIIKPEDGDHYDELVEAIAEEIRIQDPHWDELVNNVAAMEISIQRLSDSLLVSPSDAMRLRLICESIFDSPIVKHLRNSF